MCSSPYWQVGQSWFREKLSPANREQRLSRWADFAKNCLLRIGSKVLPRFREKYRALGRQKNGVQHATAIYPIPRYTRPRYIGLTLYSGGFRGLYKWYQICYWHLIIIVTHRYHAQLAHLLAGSSWCNTSSVSLRASMQSISNRCDLLRAEIC